MPLSDQSPCMDRRMFLTISGLTISSAVTGCLGENPYLPGGMTVETRHWVADILEEGIWYQRREAGKSVSRYYELIEIAEAAQRRIDGSDQVQEFVQGTNFERSYLLIVQNMMQSARWLELQHIERTDDGLDIAVETRSPDEPYGDDSTVHSLVTRVTDEQAGVPNDLRITIDREPIET